MADQEGFRVVVREQKVSPVTLTSVNIGLVIIPYQGSRLARPGREVRFFVNKNLSKTAAVMAGGSVSTILENVPLVPPPIISVDVDGTPIRDHVLEINLPSPKPKMVLRRGEIEDKGKWEIPVKVEVHDEKGCGVEADYVWEARWGGDFLDSGGRTDKDDDGRGIFTVFLPKGFRQAMVKVKLEKLDVERELTIREPAPSLPKMPVKQKLFTAFVVSLFLLLVVGALYLGR